MHDDRSVFFHMEKKVLFDPIYGVFGNQYELMTLYPNRWKIDYLD